jgi:hypothetical protein
MDSLQSALEIRQRLLSAYEQTEQDPGPARRQALMTCVSVGARPTGVELAEAIAEGVYGSSSTTASGNACHAMAFLPSKPSVSKGWSGYGNSSGVTLIKSRNSVARRTAVGDREAPPGMAYVLASGTCDGIKLELGFLLRCPRGQDGHRQY